MDGTFMNTYWPGRWLCSRPGFIPPPVRHFNGHDSFLLSIILQVSSFSFNLTTLSWSKTSTSSTKAPTVLAFLVIRSYMYRAKGGSKKYQLEVAC